MTEALVSFQDVTFGYGAQPVIQKVSFDLQPRDFLAVVGPNGGGKTTLLRLALGLSHPQQGQIRLFGEDPAHFRGWSRIGYVPQKPRSFDLYFPGSVAEVVAQGDYRGPRFLNFFHRGIAPRVREVLETVGLWDRRNERVGALSVGQQQRVLIARALIRHPELLVLDEPTGGVDIVGEESFYSLLRRLNSEDGITLLLVTHDIGVVLKEASRVACLNRYLVFHGPPSELSDVHLSQLYGVPAGLLVHQHQR